MKLCITGTAEKIFNGHYTVCYTLLHNNLPHKSSQIPILKAGKTRKTFNYNLRNSGLLRRQNVPRWSYNFKFCFGNSSVFLFTSSVKVQCEIKSQRFTKDHLMSVLFVTDTYTRSEWFVFIIITIINIAILRWGSAIWQSLCIYVELKELNHTKPAVSNKILIEKLPKEFQNICRLKIALEFKSILFKKMTVTPKGQSLQVKGSLCNAPILEVPKKSLREPAASNVLATVKQKAKKKKKKMDYQRFFQALFRVRLPAKKLNLKLSFSNSILKKSMSLTWVYFATQFPFQSSFFYQVPLMKIPVWHITSGSEGSCRDHTFSTIFNYVTFSLFLFLLKML